LKAGKLIPEKLIPFLVIAAGLLVYQNSFTGPFVFDDIVGIKKNPTIAHLWPVGPVLLTPRGNGLPTEGRPLINLSLAINHALGGYAVWGYHALNLTIHILAGLTLLGVVRRTLRLPKLRERFGAAADGLALATAVLWMIHPLQTESVTYIIQRAESIMGLCYLLTIYCFVRGTESVRPGRWYGLCVAACALGMASKEAMVSAPLMVMLYDRTFVSGSFREAWQRRRSLYLKLCGTWILLAYLVMSARSRGGTAGLGGNILWWQYALTQSFAITRYLALAFWPRPLVLDYGTHLVTDVGRLWPCILLVGLLVVATMIAIWRRPALGFLGCWLFAILAPSSSVVPIATQTIAEHRMYLPLAAVVAAVTVGGFTLARKLFGSQAEMERMVMRGSSVVVVLVLGMLTLQRNNDYRSEFMIWQDTVTKCPDNPRARTNLGQAMQQMGRVQEAVEQYQEALRLDPKNADAHVDMATVFLAQGKPQEAAAECQEVLRTMPRYLGAYVNLGNALFQMGNVTNAIEEYTQALQINPDFIEARTDLGSALGQLGETEAAIDQWNKALQLDPNYIQARANLGTAFLRLGRVTEAAEQWQRVIESQPHYAEAHHNLGVCLERSGRVREARGEYEMALQLQPRLVAAQNDLAWLLATHPPSAGGDPARALEIARSVVDLTGNRVPSYLDTLAAAYAADGRFNEAIRTAEKATELAQSAGQTQLVNRIQMRLGLYQTGRAYYQSESGAGR
jgi:tetratricopeptide (TPR) repeat protein